MAIGSSQWMYNSGDYEIDQSLRFNDDDTAYLSWTPASAGNRKTWTWSGWVKRGNLGTRQTIFDVDSNTTGTAGFDIEFFSDDRLYIWIEDGTYFSVPTSSRVFRDTSSWYHIVIQMDTAQATASNRTKVYVNGEAEAIGFAYSTTYVPQNADLFVNDARQHNFGLRQRASTTFDLPFDAYLSEVNFIDGQALTPSSFGTTGNYGEWKPKEYKGAYGTNGFYLPFKQDYAVEGFSTVTWKGNSASSAYIGGVGFQPDLTWIKVRSLAGSHHVVNSVTGASTRLQSNDPRVEAFQADNGYVGSFNTDGFTVAQGSSTHSTYTGWYETNQSGQTYVAWNWDMGNSSGTPSAISVYGGAEHRTGTTAQVGASSIRVGGVNDYLSVPDNNKFDFQGDFTVECYIKRNGTQTGSAAIISKYEVAGWILEVNASTNKVQWRDQNDGSSNHTSTTVLSDATWYHVAVTRQNDTFMMFINGTLEATQHVDYNYSISSMNTALYIGRYSAANSNGLDGWIDEIRISNSARYTSNFTPATTAFSNDSNTTLLIHSNTSNASTTFLDSSGAAVNTSGTITSNVSANPTYGQSIVSYTGTGSAATVGHGLASAPTMVIVKSRVDGYNWGVWHTGLTSADYALQLNTTIAQANTWDYWNDTAPSSSVFSVGTELGSNKVSSAYIAYCFHDVAGYSKFSSYTGNGSTTGPVVTLGFAPAFLLVKSSTAVEPWNIIDNTRNPTNPKPSIIQPNSSGAEVDTASGTGVDFTSTGFQIKTNIGNYNTSGQTYIYMAFADTREYAYWLDQSGNNNDWTSNSLTESDVMVDSPTNNFATMNPLFRNTTVYLGTGPGQYVYSEGNLRITGVSGSGGAGYTNTKATMGIDDGKWYCEQNAEAHNNSHEIGLTVASYSGGTYGNITPSTGTATIKNTAGDFQINGTVVYSSGAAFVSGDIASFAYDATNSKVWYAINGVWQGSGTQNPSTSTGGYSIVFNETAFFSQGDGGGGSNIGVWNFGQDSSFAGNKTSQGNQDSNGIGDFYYAPPTGFLALCTKNLPSVDVIPSENFNTVLYTGNGSTQSITGVGFQPDFLWIKSRNGTDYHNVFDAVRGNTKRLFTNTTDAEMTASNGVTSFDSDGFSVGSQLSQNRSASTLVAWNWKAGGTAVSNTNGTITSSVSANVDAGFSIVSYTGTGVLAATIGHGLAQKPELIIRKDRDTAVNWVVNSTVLGTGNMNQGLFLNTTAAIDTAQGWMNNTAPTSTVFTQGSQVFVSVNGRDYISYCFHSVDGYSKVGTYVGNGNANGPFVHCGFRPAFVLIKRSDSAGDDWHIMDTTRSSYNVMTHRIKANTSDAESSTDTSMDALSNGFKLRNTSGARNNGSGTYIFLAFAETPFKYSNAR